MKVAVGRSDPSSSSARRRCDGRLRGLDMTAGIVWPDGKRFAFTVFDDTDHATVDQVSSVYSFLSDCGMRTTKSVWPLRGEAAPRIGGSTCEDKEYLRWLLDLEGQGFEIALHNVAPSTSLREDVIRGLDRFKELFGHDPACFANHAGCDENIYWGADRFSGLNRTLYRSYLRLRKRRIAVTGRGHVEGDPHFWGDLCKARIKYVRNFVFRGINTLEKCRFMPYIDPQRPLVNYWFASSDGRDVDAFNDCISEGAQDLLEEQGGLCIMYTHFALGFKEDGQVKPRFRELMNRLSRKNGWFAPVHQVLDHMLSAKGVHILTPKERTRLERQWMADRVLHQYHWWWCVN